MKNFRTPLNSVYTTLFRGIFQWIKDKNIGHPFKSRDDQYF